MSSYTQNLNLFKYNTIEDLKSPYDINLCLNNNWDKLDSYGFDINGIFRGLIKAIYRIGQPIIRVDDYINEDFELRLEGGEVLISEFPELAELYGTTYGTASTTDKFKLPDFRNKALWGSTSLGYIDAGLPDIEFTVGGLEYNSKQAQYWSKQWSMLKSNCTNGTSNNTDDDCMEFKQSRVNNIYGNSDTVQPPAIKVRVVTIARYPSNIDRWLREGA